MLLEGRVALVTGASRGIGAAIARAFAAEGASLVLCARSESVDTVARELTTAQRPARAMRGDVSDAGFVRELIGSVRKEHGRLDVLVNNAGILRQGLIGMTSTEHMREMLDVNVLAIMTLTQYATRVMDSQRRPSIVNLASIAGTQGMEGVTAYSASKAAVVGYTMSCAKELAPKGIRVNAIAPGFIDTDMVRGVSADWYERRIQSIRMGRIGTPEDVAGVAVFLASPLSSYVTGQVIGVDGGMTS
ncbi:MAG: 3-oxoacyl-[acyl-carrier protein] reductase [Gemmatimonadales bacterium]|nr:3-oxoacyl-[acyl-carrier protein] reductase [Gemmatimonadales bacterium]